MRQDVVGSRVARFHVALLKLDFFAILQSSLDQVCFDQIGSTLLLSDLSWK